MTQLGCMIAAWSEQAAGGTVKLPGYHAGDRGQFSRSRAFRQGGQQGRGIGVEGLFEQRDDILFLHLLAGVLHGDALRGFRDHPHVVGDQHQSHAGFSLQVQQ